MRPLETRPRQAQAQWVGPQDEAGSRGTEWDRGGEEADKKTYLVNPNAG